MVAVAAEPIRHVIRCPVPGCGQVLGEVAGDGPSFFWRVCPTCKASVRFELPSRRWTIECGPTRRR